MRVHEKNKSNSVSNIEINKSTKQIVPSINQHFLFNTLNSILSLCRENSEEARKVVLELSSYLRFNFDVTDGIVFLHEEIEYIKSYLYIQKVRFDHRLNIVYDIQGDVNFLIPKNSLYNLIENAIIHGILKKNNGGTIIFTVVRDSEKIVIKIKDDGVGMDDVQIRGLFKDENEGSISSLKSQYSELYNAKLEVISKLNIGTCLTVYIPIENIKYE
ncbi:histidine kinase [Clostridium estertheticum]|uniref:sensor histidine kinase n=1 Tax=Clostridium estertheticum TaxID=238834 RepID=UPI0013E9410C|nr:histidine kinase [Clostridium estertheticum]MBZ9688652.1 histidine kinase [Clostridium estertheticum]